MNDNDLLDDDIVEKKVNNNPSDYIEKIFKSSILLSRFVTGNSFIDSIISYIALLLLSYLFEKLKYTISFIPNIMNNFFKFIIYIFPRQVQRIYKVYIKRQKIPKYIYKTVEISYITDNKQINELYKAVSWYLSNSPQINYIVETPLKLTYEKRISDKVNDFDEGSINQFIALNKVNKLYYNKHIIYYSLTTEVISIFMDREKKRENYKITLSADIDSSSDFDILVSFCTYCTKEYIKSLNSSIWVQNIYTNQGKEWVANPSNNRRKIDTIILQNNLKEKIKKDVQLFINSEDWYKNRDIPYTRGYLFYGHPGTGKTSMIKGLSLYCKRHIHYLILSNISSDIELFELLSNINYRDTILVIEDIDCMDKIVKDRSILKKELELKELELKELELKEIEKNNKINLIHKQISDLEFIDKPVYKTSEYGYKLNDQPEKNSKTLTLSGLLNALDGPFTRDGRIMIMTTNHPDILDTALIRPGRVDVKYLFDYCDKQQIKELYEMFFETICDEKLLNSINDRRYSPAHITSVFLKYRDNPEETFLHLDDENKHPLINPINVLPINKLIEV